MGIHMQNSTFTTMQEISVEEVTLVSGGVIFDDWWASNRDVCLPQRISKYDLINAF